MQRLFTMPIEITAARFGSNGQLIPTRVTIDGMSYRVYTSTTGDAGFIRHIDQFFLLGRLHRSWKIMPITESL